MSGLVRTSSAWSRANARDSLSLSPSWVVARSFGRSSSNTVGQLVVGQSLGRGEVEHRRSGPVVRAPRSLDGGQCRQKIGEGLSGGRAGGHDHMLSGVSELGGADLVLPGPLDVSRHEGRHDLVGGPVRPVGPRALPAGDALEVGQALLAAGPGEQMREDRTVAIERPACPRGAVSQRRFPASAATGFCEAHHRPRPTHERRSLSRLRAFVRRVTPAMRRPIARRISNRGA